MKPRILSTVIFASVSAFSASLHAADATWGANGNSAWYTGTNWAGGGFPGLQGLAASNTDIATFTSAFTATQTGINMGTNSLNLGVISLDSSRITATSIGNSSGTAGVLRLYGATVSGVNNVILNNAGTGLLTLQAAQNGTMGVVLSNATNNIIRITNTGGVTISSIVSGSGSNLTLQGSGTGVLTLTGANTYSGVTTLNAGPTANSGTLALSGASGTILNTSGITLNGGILQLTNASGANVADRVSATITSNGGRINFANTNTSGQTYAETLAVSLETSHLVFNQTINNSSSNGQTLTLTSLAHSASNTSTVSFVAATTGPTDALGKNRFLVSSGATNTAGIVGAWAITNTVVSGNSVPDYATYNGSGYVVPLGATAITNHAGLVAAGAGANVNFGGSATLDLAALRTLNTLRITNTSSTPTINLNAFNLETFGILSAGSTGGAAISQGTGSGFLTIPTATPGGAVGESANLYISGAGRGNAISVAIKDNGASKLTLVKSGLAGVTSTGTLVLSNTGNSYSGDTVVNEGDLNLGASNVIPDGASKGNLVLDGSNARFLMTPQTAGTAFSETINGLNGRGTVLSNATSGTSTLTVGSGDANGNFSGTLINGGVAALALTKTGAGTQTLSGANTYTGATNVNGGKLVVNGNISTSTLTTVAVGATLEGVGTVGKAIINGTLAVGNSPGTMTFTDTLGLNGTTIMEIDGSSGAGATGGHDFVNLTGVGAAGVLTTGGTMTLDMGVIFGVGTYSWNLFDMASEAGTFASISLADQYSGSLINSSGVWDLISGDNTWKFTESTGVLGLTVIPEPNVAALLGGLGTLLLLRRRR